MAKEFDNEIKNEKAIVKDFTHTTTPGSAQREIFNFIEAAGLSLTVRQLVILNGLLKHYKNLHNHWTNKRLQGAQGEIHQLKIRLGEHIPGTVKE